MGRGLAEFAAMLAMAESMQKTTTREHGYLSADIRHRDPNRSPTKKMVTRAMIKKRRKKGRKKK